MLIARLTCPANGSSQPWYCELDDGTSWVVKFAGAGPGVEALLAEFLANSLGVLWGLPIPECKAVLLDKAVPRAGTDEFWDVLDASEGWNLAIREVAGAVNLVPSMDLPKPTLQRMLAYDTLLANWDRTALSRNLLQDNDERVWWIDHGSCRFLHQLTKQESPSLPSNHFLFAEKEQFATSSALPEIESEAIESLIAAVPERWLDGRQPTPLAQQLTAYLRGES